MENNSYRVNIAKWLPILDSAALSSSPCVKMIELKSIIMKHTQNVIFVSEQLENCVDCYNRETLESFTNELKNITQRYECICATGIMSCNTLNVMYNYKINHLFSSIKRFLHVLAKCYYNFINNIIDDKDEEMIVSIFRLVNAYNALLKLKIEISQPSINIFSNDCPSILDGFNQNITMMRIFQVLAKKRAEGHCHELINCLLAIYQPCEQKKLKSPCSADEISENSSVEIYRALTTHMTPSHTTATEMNSIAGALNEKQNVFDNLETLNSLVNSQAGQVENLIILSKDLMSSQFFNDNIFKHNHQGQLELSRRKLKKFSDYYQRISWAAVSEILDHVILWWSTQKIVAHNNYSVGIHDLQDWLHQFIHCDKNDIPTCVKLTLLNLCDALGCHVTITCWDEIFRLAYIAVFENTSSPYSTGGTDTGHLFIKTFRLLVNLSNKCETSDEWMIGAPLMELALSEQIIILHRLDHSIHTMRLWASQESKIIAHTWELERFFLIVKSDLNNCINELSHLKLADHTTALTVDYTTISVQVYVCGRMRAKIVSEVNANILLLKKSSNSSITILAKICRVICMANLHMCLPMASYWNKRGTAVNIEHLAASPYIKIYLERVLLPVLEVLDDHEISNMVLTIMCEAWLDYIYLDKIKFSESGSYQLLTDFAYVSQWISECSVISQNMKERLLKNEVLRRCEGVGKLLLRHPGEAISMQKEVGTRNDNSGSPISLGLERMPAEMYVPNQEQWLELRARRSYKFCRCID